MPPGSLEEVPVSYMEIASAACMKDVIKTIANASGGVLYHCTAGKGPNRCCECHSVVFLGGGYRRKISYSSIKKKTCQIISKAPDKIKDSR